MLFDLWILCVIATGLGMFLVSLIQDLATGIRRWFERRQAESPRLIPACTAGQGQSDAAASLGRAGAACT
jgi:hypothetical protein